MLSRATKMTIKQVSKELQEGVIQSSEFCQASLQRINNTKYLNNFITVSSELAKNQVQYSEKLIKSGSARSPLEGLPVAVKDNFCTSGVRTTCASKMLENFIPSYNATVVQKLIDHGACIVGKTNMDEFAMGSGAVDSAFGPTRNVWKSQVENLNTKVDPEDWFIAGGSSGGSAAAVASGACFAALGSDTGGSTRTPAAYCGVVGLKPTYGLLSRHGLIPLVNSMDVPGIVARNVEDTTLILNILAGWDSKDSTTVSDLFEPIDLEENFSLSRLTVGIPTEYHNPDVDQQILDIWSDVASLLERLGAKVIPVSLPHTKYSIACYSILNHCEVASNMARYDGIEFGFRAAETKSTEEMFAASRSHGFNQVVRGRIISGNYFLLSRNYENHFMQALKLRRLISEDFLKVWAKGVDLLLSPVTLGEAPRYSDFKLKDNREQCATQDYCTQPANLAGCPAISIPIRLSKGGMPLGLQLLAPNFGERNLLNVARKIETEVDFPTLMLDDCL
ncbi:glutamyl-tRNA(Gln) amidotransferase subunit A, mitochondrial [Neocloeon triangulifer]|uniref:glutamyl-tRNA(Gln) amidotransferase subunit A, mitochondrial n=1 Tax=Neocloeon triangulifer TaxID=2078957 RepID=UPI00286EE694|nr:glutamyl-tRNA(Gln) amidotransferase subunit A, mitochondrial [Neocloeon triangulifer]